VLFELEGDINKMKKILISGLLAFTTLLGACSSQEAATKEPKKEVKQEEPKKEYVDLSNSSSDKSQAELYADIKEEYNLFHFQSAESNGYTYVGVTGGETVIYRDLQQTLTNIAENRKELAERLQNEVGIPKVRFYIKMINGDTNEKSNHTILFENGQVEFDK
jgi:ABC-type phosphate/phosphonate transport system substrate-binding protein